MQPFDDDHLLNRFAQFLLSAGLTLFLYAELSCCCVQMSSIKRLLLSASVTLLVAFVKEVLIATIVDIPWCSDGCKVDALDIVMHLSGTAFSVLLILAWQKCCAPPTTNDNADTSDDDTVIMDWEKGCDDVSLGEETRDDLEKGKADLDSDASCDGALFPTDTDTAAESDSDGSSLGEIEQKWGDSSSLADNEDVAEP